MKPAKPYRDEHGLLLVPCPHCGEVNEFPNFDQIFIFICDDCDEPVSVEEPVQ